MSSREGLPDYQVPFVLWLKGGWDLGRTSTSVSCTPTPAHTALISGKIGSSLRKQTGEGRQCLAAEMSTERAVGFAKGKDGVRTCRWLLEATYVGTSLCYESTPSKDPPLPFFRFFLFEYDPHGTKNLVKILVETVHNPQVFLNKAHFTKYSV